MSPSKPSMRETSGYGGSMRILIGCDTFAPDINGEHYEHHIATCAGELLP